MSVLQIRGERRVLVPGRARVARAAVRVRAFRPRVDGAVARASHVPREPRVDAGSTHCAVSPDKTVVSASLRERYGFGTAAAQMSSGATRWSLPGSLDEGAPRDAPYSRSRSGSELRRRRWVTEIDEFCFASSR